MGSLEDKHSGKVRMLLKSSRHPQFTCSSSRLPSYAVSSSMFLSATSSPTLAGSPIPPPGINIYPGNEHPPQGLLAQMNHSPPELYHRGSDFQARSPLASPQPTGAIDFKALDERLNAAFTKKIETMAKDLQASWTSSQTHQDPPLASSVRSAPSTWTDKKPLLPRIHINKLALWVMTLDRHLSSQ